MKITTRITLEGNFFSRDPKKTFRANVRDMLDALAAWQESEIRNDIAGHAGAMPAYTGWTHDRVIGRTRSITGRQWGLNAVVSANTAGMSRQDAIRTKAAAASIERRWHPFRRVKSASVRARALIVADLTKGLD